MKKLIYLSAILFLSCNSTDKEIEYGDVKPYRTMPTNYFIGINSGEYVLNDSGLVILGDNILDGRAGQQNVLYLSDKFLIGDTICGKKCNLKQIIMELQSKKILFTVEDVMNKKVRYKNGDECIITGSTNVGTLGSDHYFIGLLNKCDSGNTVGFRRLEDIEQIIGAQEGL